MSDVTPFETTENGFYRVTEPVEGMEPDLITIRLDGRTFRLSDFAGKDVESHVLPNVLVYRDCEVIEEGDDA